MAALTMSLSHDLGSGGFFALSGEMGIADLGTTAAISSTSQAEFNSLRLDVGSRSVLTRGDRLAIGIAMPMAVTSGAADMIVPVSGTSGGAEVRSVALDLAPQERQVDLSISYQVPMSDRSEFLMEMVHAENYGNIAGATDSAAVIGMKWSF
jgi:subtilase-type serine protease